jgi:tetratricopeptide (TPR) repeat protein
VLLMPQDAGFAERLREINAIHGFEDEVPAGQGLFEERFYKTNGKADSVTSVVADPQVVDSPADFAIVGAVIESSNGGVAFEVQGEFEPELIEEAETHETDIQPPAADGSPEARLRREAESIKFYIDNGYTELAQKAIIDLEADFGSVPEIAELRSYMGSQETIEELAAAVVPEPAQPEPKTNSGLFDLGELRSELGLEEPEPVDDSDFETKYQTAVAYQEMGLLEQAIAEFQDAAALVGPNDGTRRFFNCANLLGLCFMESGMPKLAMKWYQRALEIKNLNSDEKLALWYELGIAFEAEGELDEAERFFEQVYAENVDYRDVRSRVKNLVLTH